MPTDSLGEVDPIPFEATLDNDQKEAYRLLGAAIDRRTAINPSRLRSFIRTSRQDGILKAYTMHFPQRVSEIMDDIDQDATLEERRQLIAGRIFEDLAEFYISALEQEKNEVRSRHTVVLPEEDVFSILKKLHPRVEDDVGRAGRRMLRGVQIPDDVIVGIDEKTIIGVVECTMHPDDEYFRRKHNGFTYFVSGPTKPFVDSPQLIFVVPQGSKELAEKRAKHYPNVSVLALPVYSGEIRSFIDKLNL